MHIALERFDVDVLLHAQGVSLTVFADGASGEMGTPPDTLAWKIARRLFVSGHRRWFPVMQVHVLGGRNIHVAAAQQYYDGWVSEAIIADVRTMIADLNTHHHIGLEFALELPIWQNSRTLMDPGMMQTFHVGPTARFDFSTLVISAMPHYAL